MTVDNLELGLLDDASARQAIEIVGEIANEHGIDWALAADSRSSYTAATG